MYKFMYIEMTDNVFPDYISYMKGDHPWAREMFREKLRELKAQRMEYLVIDLRNNYGGRAEVGHALVSLLRHHRFHRISEQNNVPFR